MQKRHPIKLNICGLKKKAEELGMVGHSFFFFLVGHSLNNKSYLPKISANITLTG